MQVVLQVTNSLFYALVHTVYMVFARYLLYPVKIQSKDEFVQISFLKTNSCFCYVLIIKDSELFCFSLNAVDFQNSCFPCW